ncbi:ATP-binding protein [Streptosporangium amethystogenes subsp. fukuiense]|uniref:ATP-binding protein n=1 Tax=Streptosporangium amethystogenes subsp. fukuiense TaxID=698418 RepID=A0ABW2T9J2_9ACTN
MNIPVEVKPDFIERVARRGDPVGAVEELIWNGLDADAEEISVEIESNDLDGIDSITITDTGHGIPADSVHPAFSGMGGSWKKNAKGTNNRGRQLHGRHGYGRFRVLALGSTASWVTVANWPTARTHTTVRFSDGASVFDLEGSRLTEEEPGTTVRVVGDAPRKNRLLSERVRFELTSRFAAYLSKYPDIKISWRGQQLDPSEVIYRQDEYALDLDDAGTAAARDMTSAGPVLRIVEWSTKPQKRELLICDDQGVHRLTLSTGIQAPDFNFTAYILWHRLRNLSEYDSLDGEFEIDDTPLGRVVKAARDQMRIHFRMRESERTKEQVERWIQEGVYPYSGLPGSDVEVAERATFDDVAVFLSHHFKGGKQARRTQLVLLSEALRRQPTSISKVLEDLFSLSVAQKEQIERLVSRASLGNIVAANAQTVDRVDFLALLRNLLYEPEAKWELRERDQLHRMLEKELWIFGDEFSSAVSETGLTEALERHLAILEGTAPRRNSRRPVRRADGRSGRLDLMLSGVTGADKNKRHLIVELKRPSLTLTEKELAQLRSYAFTVVSDDRYKHDEKTRWDFWLIGNTIDEALEWQIKGSGLPPNCVQDDGRVGLWVFRWGQILDMCEERVRKTQERLNYASSVALAAEYAERVHADANVIPLLPPA